MRRRTLLAVLAAGIIATAVLAPVVTDFPETTHRPARSSGLGPLSHIARIGADFLLIAAVISGIVTAVRLLNAPVRREAEQETEHAKVPGGRNAFILALFPLLLALAIWGGASMVGQLRPQAPLVSRAVSANDNSPRQREVSGPESGPAPSHRTRWLIAAAVVLGIALVAALVLVLRRRRFTTTAESPPPAADTSEAEQEPVVTGDVSEMEVLIAYRDMCRLFTALNGTETLHLTPRQILRRIEEFGIAASDAASLTRLFEEARYGHRTLSPEAAAGVRRIGQRLRMAFGEVIRE